MKVFITVQCINDLNAVIDGSPQWKGFQVRKLFHIRYILRMDAPRVQLRNIKELSELLHII